jgi:hypothetical protein
MNTLFRFCLTLFISGYCLSLSGQTVSVGPKFSMKKMEGSTSLIPCNDGGHWLAVNANQTTITGDQTELYPPELVHLAKVDGNGTKVFEADFKGRQGVFAGYNLIGLFGDASGMILISTKNVKPDGVTFQKWKIDEQGKVSKPEELWSFTVDANELKHHTRFYFEISRWNTHFMLADYQGDHYASFTAKGDLVMEGSYTDRDRLTRVKKMGVSESGDIAALYFTNQNDIFVTVNQNLSVRCAFATGEVRMSQIAGGAGYVSPRLFAFAFKANGNMVIGGFSYEEKGYYKMPVMGLYTELFRTKEEAVTFSFPASTESKYGVMRVDCETYSTDYVVLGMGTSDVYEIAPDQKIRTVTMLGYRYGNSDVMFGKILDTPGMCYAIMPCDANCRANNGKGKSEYNAETYSNQLILARYVPGSDPVQELIQSDGMNQLANGAGFIPRFINGELRGYSFMKWEGKSNAIGFFDPEGK